MTTNKISHVGVVDSITDHTIRVCVQQSSACTHCSASRQCNASEAKVKWIDVDRDFGKYQSLHIGDSVVVSATLGTAGKALLLCFGVPFLLLITVLVFVLKVTHEEFISALMSLASLIPYYILLYFLRNKIKRGITFSIESVNE